VCPDALGEEPRYKRNVIPSWGDMTLVHGPGTFPAMDSPEAMRNMIRHWKGRGFTGVYLRSDLNQFLPGSVIRHDRGTQPEPGLAVMWNIVDEIMERSDPHAAASKAAKELGFDYWIFHPYIYSEGAPVDVGVPGVGRMVPWSYMRRAYREHPEIVTVDRLGNKQWMVPEYAYEVARQDKVAEFVHMAKTYRPRGIVASMRSESSQLIPPPDHGDQYGFNEPIVEEMKRLYGVDILTDRRFDWRDPEFKQDDPLVENWRTLRGKYITELYREIRRGMKEAAPEVQLAVTLSGNYVGPIMGNARLDWKTWVDEGLMDAIVSPVFFEATLDLEAEKKGYLTHSRAGIGTVSAVELKDYIRQSRHPEIEVIQTGASSYFYDPPPEGADGWQCDAWYDAYHLAWYQRWEQWRGDLKEFGRIRFFDQNFDGFPVRSRAFGGGFGDGRYHPELRSCPGVWYRLGDGTDDRPYIQQEIRRGETGSAMAFTIRDILGAHPSSPDRSLPTSLVDTAIANGKAEFSWWIYRSEAGSSGEFFFSGNAGYEKDVGLRIEPQSGRVTYKQGEEWKPTEGSVPLKEWTRLAIKVDVDALRYSATLGEAGTELCSEVPIGPAKERFVIEHGVNIPIRVPSYRIFNALMFVPTQGGKTPFYIDDVAVDWTPTMHYAEGGETVLFAEDFEKDQPQRETFGHRSIRSENFFVEQTTSFGEGVHCARGTGGGEFVATLETHASGKRITVDLDLFVRSNKDFPYILPDPTTKSPHSTSILLEGDGGEIVAGVELSQGTWRIWNGKEFADTGKRISYDVWNHVQLAIDRTEGKTRLIVQPVGALPEPYGEAECPGRTAGRLRIVPSATKGHISCYDNFVVTAE